jgi:hypothetical protein
MYGTFDQIVNDHGKSKLHILHYDLLNRACLTTITLSVKSFHIECMNNFTQGHVCEGGIFLY